ISLEGLNGPKLVFSGTAREGAAGFPPHVNVAAGLGAGGVGTPPTRMENLGDPSGGRQLHTPQGDSRSGHLTPPHHKKPPANPRTGRITALSVVTALRKLKAPLRIGT